MVKIRPEVLNGKEYLVKTRRHLHKNPELSLQEYKTANFIRKELEKIGLAYSNIGDTGTLAIIKGAKPGKSIFLRADIDALPMEDLKNVDYASINKGVCHSCGHDGHAASLLLATKVLYSLRDRLEGTIKIAFQQAEEIGAGARQFVSSGALNDVDFAFGIHAASYLDVGKIGISRGASMASCDIFSIDVIGQGSHASSPHLGKDAALASASILVELQALSSRQKNPLEPVVISIGKIEAGTSYNVVASKGKIEGTLRTLDKELRSELLDKIEMVASKVASIHGCDIRFNNYDAANVLYNDQNLAESVEKLALELVGQGNIVKDLPVTLGAEDFADYTAEVPGLFVRVGTRTSEETGFPHHNERFNLDENGLLIAASLYIEIAMNVNKL